MAKLKINDRVRVLVGVYTGQEGRVESLSDAPLCIGVHIFGGKKEVVLPLTWFRPEEVEKIS